MDGGAFDMGRLVDRSNLAVGDVLPIPTAAERNEVHKLDHRVGRNEKFWRRRLSSVEPYSMSHQSGDVESSDAPITVEDTFPAGLSEHLLKELPGCDQHN